MKKVHQLKVNSNYWDKYLKTESWSIRKDDRGFNIGDYCLFQAVICHQAPPNCEKTMVIKEITGITDHDNFGEGIADGYCILDLKLIRIIKYD